MEIVIVPTPADGGRIVADVVARALAGPGPVNLGLATGSSPLLAYAELIRRHREDGLSFAGASAYLLDEYVGLPAGHPQSYRQVIRDELTDHVDIDPARVHGPDGTHPDPVKAAAEYEQLLTGAGPIRRAAARDRRQRPHRVQRAQLVAGVDDPDQDPREPHPGRQRPLLRPGARTCPATCSPRGSAPSAGPSTSCSPRRARRRPPPSPPRWRAR